METWLRKKAKQIPDELFIQQGNQQFSFGDTLDSVFTFAKILLRENIKPQDKIFIFLPGGVDAVEIILACFEVGAIAVPVSTKFTDHELQKTLNTVNPSLIITDWKTQSRFSHKSFPILCIEECINSSAGCGFIEISNPCNPDDVCAILLTSGTTNLPKAVQLTYSNFESSCENWHDFLDFQGSDQFLCCLPLHHIGGMAVIIRGLIYGFSVNLVTGFNADVIYKAVRDHAVTIISLVPTLLKRILEIPGGIQQLSSLRYILLGGGPASDTLLNDCIRKKITVIKTYGMTETCSGIVGLSILEEPEKCHFAGRPFKDVNVAIEKDSILISGPMVMKGYLNEPESKGVHDSQDLGHIEKDLLFLDVRRKDLIVSGGENVNPREVEAVILSYPNVADAAVTGIPDEEWGQKVIAYLVSPGKINQEKIHAFCREKLSGFKCPKEFQQLAEIPRNVIGKVDQPRLKNL